MADVVELDIPGLGRVKGMQEDEGQVCVFKRIPFAASPTGEHRFAPPLPVASWDGVRDATQDGPIAFQQDVQSQRFLEAMTQRLGLSAAQAEQMMTASKEMQAAIVQDEDCLTLTIRTPRKLLFSSGGGSGPNEKRAPVMVWIHGGDHQAGSGSSVAYSTNTFALKGAVFVSINYRLGLFGYFAHPDLSKANAGTMDQIMALQWVQNYITAFGGDPSNVTIFGESAGGESVIHLMCSPAARGLFHRAIAQSPCNMKQLVHRKRPQLTFKSAEEAGVDFATKLVGPQAGQLDRLRLLPAADLAKAYNAGVPFVDPSNWQGFYPCIDPTDDVIPDCCFEAFRRGNTAEVPFMVGSNSDEGTCIAAVLKRGPGDYGPFNPGINPDPVKAAMAGDCEVYGGKAAELAAMYPGLGGPNADRPFSDFCGDGAFGFKTRWYARGHSTAGRPTFLYLFSRQPPAALATAGAFHGADLSFVFGSPAMGGESENDGVLAGKMQNYWLAFAATGDPNSHGAGNPKSQEACEHWPAFDPLAPRHFVLDHVVANTPILQAPKYDLMDLHLARVLAKTGASQHRQARL